MNSSGAVSPAARATASSTPVKRPGRAAGRITIHTACVVVQPMPTAASRMRCGTMRMASSAVSSTISSMRIDRAMPPARAENVPMTVTTRA